MFTNFLLKSKLVSDDSSYLSWEWNPFVPRFWKKKAIITNFECTYSNINSEYGVDIQKIVTSFNHWNKASEFNAPIGLDNLFNPINYYYDQNLEPSGTVGNPVSEVTYNLQECHPVTNNGQVITIATEKNILPFSQVDLSAKYLPTSTETKDRLALKTVKKGLQSNPLLDLFDSTPKYMLNSPLLPTPEHFKNVDFDFVISSGYNLSQEQITYKGKILSGSIWLILFSLIMSFFVFIVSLTNTIFTIMNQSDGLFSFLLTTMYSLGFMVFLSVNYLIYSHIHWQYRKNKFASLHDYIKEIHKEPFLILPMRIKN